MSITVEKLSMRFPMLQDRDIQKLVGKTDVKGSDVIPLNNLARCNDVPIQTYVAQMEGNPFIALLPVKQQKIVAPQTAEKSNLAQSGNENKATNPVKNIFGNTNYSNVNIPMDRSIFTLSNQHQVA